MDRMTSFHVRVMYHSGNKVLGYRDAFHVKDYFIEHCVLMLNIIAQLLL